MSGVPPRGGGKSCSVYAMAQNYDINLRVNGVDEATNEVDGLTESMEQAGQAGSQAFGQLDQMLGGVPSKIKGAIGGVRNFARGMKTLRGAIISTGIGALVIALTALVTYFTKTQRGAEMLEKAQAGLGAAVAIITDKFSAFGESLINFFSDPIQSIQDFGESLKTYVMDRVEAIIDGFGMLGKAIGALFRGEFSEAAELAAQGFTDIGQAALELNPAFVIVDQVAGAVGEIATEMSNAATSAVKLADAAIRLRKDQRDLRVEMAQSRRDIKAYNLIAEDTTKGFEERIEAAQKAIDIEKGLMSERKRQAEEELRIHEQNMALSESTEEDLEKQADLKAKVFDLEKESLELQTTLNNKLNTLMAARTAAMEAEEKARTDAKAKELAERQKLDEQAAAAEKKLQEDKEKAIAELTTSARTSTFDILKQLTAASTKDTEESAKKAFNRNKAISIAETLVNTYMAAQKAYASQIIPLDPTSVIRAQIAAGIAVASGLAKVAAIKSTQYTGGGGGGGAAAGSGGVGVGGGIQSVGVDVGTLVPNATQTTPEPVRAYVVSNEISNKQALDRELQIQTTL